MATAPFSPSVAPMVFQKDGTPFSGDRNFALHGEIMMLILVMLFTIFILSIVFFLYMKRVHGAAKLGPPELVSPSNYSFPMFKGQINYGLKSLHQSEDSERAHHHHQPV
uniref:Uncharacterized protein n=1 Tax=Davidia involucrata TaxID=16924 RepID=A0A5B6ZMN3_DAVIN